MTGVGVDEVKEGDILTASINADNKYYGDRYAFFDKKKISVSENEEFTLVLKGFWGMASEEKDLTPSAFSGLSVGIWENGELKAIEDKATDEDGMITLSLSEAGTYIISAEGTVKAIVTDWWTMKEVEAECPIIAPFCIVTVEALVPPESITIEHDAENIIDDVILAKKGDKFKLSAYDENEEETPVTWKNTSYGNMVTIDEVTGEVEVTGDIYGGTSYLYFEATSTIDDSIKTEITVLMTGYLLSQHQKEQKVTLSEDGQTAKTAALNAGKKGHNIWNYNIPEGVGELVSEPGSGGEIKFNVYRPGIIEVGFALDINEELKDSGTITIEGVAVEGKDGERGKIYLELSESEDAPTAELKAFLSEGREVASWKSLDESIATVDDNGVVKATGVGSVIIQAEDSEGAKGGIKVVVESKEIPYFESIEFQTSYLASGSWIKNETFKPTVSEYNVTIARYSLSSLVFLDTTIYDDKKYIAVARYKDTYGEEHEVNIGNGVTTTLTDIPFGTSIIAITLYEKDNETNKTVYTFNVTRPRDKTKALRTVTVNPEDRSLSNTLYDGYKEGTMLRCDEEGNLTSGIGVSGTHYYYRTYVYGKTDFDISFAASTSYAHVRYSADKENWIEVDKTLKSEKFSFDEGNTINLFVEVIDDESYSSGKEDGEDGFNEDKTEKYKICVMNVSAEAPKMLTAEAKGDWYPAFSKDVFTYRVMIDAMDDAPVLSFKTEEAIVKDGNNIIEPDENGVYTVTLTNMQKSISLSDSDGKCVNTYKFQYTKKSALDTPDKVIEAVYIGGQYSGSYDVYPELSLIGTVRSLGNFGGYITYYFEEPIVDNPANTYGMDFYVFGNSAEKNIDSMAELGQVYVSEDNETWFALAGSEHYEDKAIWDYKITYKKGEDGKAYWTDNYGNEMLPSAAKAWPLKEKYPLNPYTENDEYIFTGILFESQLGSVMGDSTNGSFASRASFGYADYYMNGKITDGRVEDINSYVENPTMANGFDLLWAVDSEGNPIDVSEMKFHYVRVATASNIWAGSFFEKSTEVCNVIRTAPKNDAVGKTKAPGNIILTDGISEVKVNLSNEKNVYDVELGTMKYISVKVPEAEADDNIYINNRRITNDEVLEGFKVTKEAGKLLIRIIVQNGEKEPFIALLRISGEATESDEIIEGIKINASGDIRKAETKNGKDYFSEVGSKIEKIKIFPVVENGVTYTVNGKEALTEYELSYGQNSFEIVASSNGETETVTLVVTRENAPSVSEGKISVSFMLYGDEQHSEDEVHTYTENKKDLPIWIEKTTYKVSKGTTVSEVLELALSDADINWVNADGNYISEINGLAEFDNGPLSGWMYMVNGKYPELGISEQSVRNGDDIIFHYTDDYTEEKSTYKVSSSSSGKKKKKEEAEKETSTENKETELQNTAKQIFSETTYRDVKKESWYYDAVKYNFENSLMLGTGNDFEPDKNMTRAMLVTVLYRISGAEAGKYNAFTDVKDDAWYASAVKWASENGIVKGIAETEFAPDKEVTREQMVTIFMRYLAYRNIETLKKADLSDYNDSNAVSSWAKDAFSVAVNLGLVKGTDKDTLSPKNSATRAQVAMIIKRLCENILK